MKAFPRTTKMWKNSNEDSYEIVSDEGMDLRDYFAAKAMQGLMSRVDHVNGDCVTNASPDDVAGYAYVLSEAMMKAREMRKAREL